jgi:hypothetical protein
MNYVLERKKLHAEQLMAIFYGDGKTPSEAFLRDIGLLIKGKITDDEVRTRIIARHNQETI